MRFLTISSTICVSAAVFYSAFLLSKCRANDIPGIVSVDIKIQDGNVVYIYRTAVPSTPVELKENNWTVSRIILIAVGIGCVIFICFGKCDRLSSLLIPRRQSAKAALIPGPHSVIIQRDAAPHGPISNTTNTHSGFGNITVHYTFNGNSHYMKPDDGPPQYFSVVSQSSPNCMPEHNAVSPQVSGTKTDETPPPTYVSVSTLQ